MGLRSAIGDRLVRVGKTFGGQIPPAMAAGEQASQMTPATPFSPGTPIRPADGYQRTPRTHDFNTGYNISARPRINERVSFQTLRGLVEAYDIAQICIWHRIDSLRALDWKLVAADGYTGDVTDAIAQGKKALKKPDGIHKFHTWFASWMYDVLAYDAGCLYRLRNRDGTVRGLAVVDGTTIAPLQDYWGNPPMPAAPGEPAPEAFVQYIQGLSWNWLTMDDLVYEPFRPTPGTLYGKAPLETILLNANTDLRFQLYFLEKFTEGNIPAAFASAPETWGPEQITQFQEYWDAYMLGDQARKHQVQWMPGGSKFAWSNEKDFEDHFSLFLMRKTLSAYHVVPSDLGFTETVNKSSGESQADVAHRVGELPLEGYAEGILDGFLQDDLKLPVAFKFDRGEEQDDRKDQAEADKIYVDMGAIGPSEIREMRYGRTEPGGRPIPRFINTSRSGPVPLAALFALAGEIDDETGAPAVGAQLPHQVFAGAPGVVPNPPIEGQPLAEEEYGVAALPPAPPQQPELQAAKSVELAADKQVIVKGADGQFYAVTLADVIAGNLEPRLAAGHRYMTVDEARELGRAAMTKDGAPAAPAAPAAGITADTGLYGYDLDEDDDDKPKTIPGNAVVAVDKTAVVKAELAAFRRFKAARRRAGTWRDFGFRTVDATRAHRLNDAGRFAVRKAAGEIAVAGLAVLAADTGRVLMLQRALCDDDPAGGMWEFPGGHLEDGETPLRAAWREWAEETSLMPPPGAQTGTWTSPNGIYQGIVWTVESEASVPVRGAGPVTNPDDPDGDQIEAVAWWDPSLLAGNPAIRTELAENLPEVLAALGCTPGDGGCCGADCCQGEGGCCGGDAGCSCGPAQPVQGDEGTCPCGTPAVFDELNGWQHADGSISHDDTDQSVSDLMGPVAKAYPAGQTYSSHAHRPTPGAEIVCWYCGVGPTAPLHEAYSDSLHALRKAGGGDPKAGSWPGWEHDLAAAAHWAQVLTAALSAAVSKQLARQLAAIWLTLHPGSGLGGDRRQAVEATAAWFLTSLQSQGIDPYGCFTGPAEGMTADGFMIGATSAAALTDGQAPAWDGWTPGDTTAGHDRAAALGLAGTLATAIVFAQSQATPAITEGYAARAARVLLDAAKDVTADELGDLVYAALLDDSYARGVALTWLGIAAGRAAVALYLNRQVAYGQWASAEDGKVCPACQGNVDAGPVRIGDSYPSGDTQAPAHPRCRCQVIPAGNGRGQR